MVLNLLSCFLPMLPSFKPSTIYLTLRKSIKVNGLVKNALEFVPAHTVQIRPTLPITHHMGLGRKGSVRDVTHYIDF
jgi:hypothetical protein